MTDCSGHGHHGVLRGATRAARRSGGAIECRQDAIEFCEKLSQATGRRLRLPTEADWEYACRHRIEEDFRNSVVGFRALLEREQTTPGLDKPKTPS